MMDMTPYAFAALFLRKEVKDDIDIMVRSADTVIKWNQRYTTPKGKVPLIPTWFLSKLTKARHARNLSSS